MTKSSTHLSLRSRQRPSRATDPSPPSPPAKTAPAAPCSPATIAQALEAASRYLQDKGLRSPARDAQLLLASLLHKDSTFLLTHPEHPLTEAEAKRLREWVQLRGEHYPIQYLRGTQEFYGRDFMVSPAVLIPRPETELLVEAGLDLLGPDPPPVPVLDVGTGSGAIAISLLCELPRLRAVGVDISSAALQICRLNALRHCCEDRLELLQGDTLEPVLHWPDRFSLIVSNPPYVSPKEGETVDPSVRRYEPPEAVFANKEGLAVYEKIFRHAPGLLAPGGTLLLELGFGKARAVQELAQHWGWNLVWVRRDLAGIERCAAFQVT